MSRKYKPRAKKPDLHMQKMQFFVDCINDTNERRQKLIASGAHRTMRIDGLMSVYEFDRIESEKRHRREQQ